MVHVVLKKRFKIVSEYSPTGDQPKAIEYLSAGLKDGEHSQILVGATGSGKTFTMACVVEQVQRPTLVIAHNKTLAAQLATEFQMIFPENSVQYFVSYYDYYQPEAYIPRSDTYIEKESNINEEIDRLRHAATQSLLTRNDTLIVASVSCIYGLGSPEEYLKGKITASVGDELIMKRLARRLADMHYERNDLSLARGTFRIRGDTLEIVPIHDEFIIRLNFWGDELERISLIDIVTGKVTETLEEIEIFPGKHFITPEDKLGRAVKNIEEELESTLKIFQEHGKLLEAQRLKQRTDFDLEMLLTVGYCHGIENYSRHLAMREMGTPPDTLLDYFPDDFLVFIDESHITMPQLKGMYNGDKSRKTTLVKYGFRLPSALDNRPLSLGEFETRINQIVYVSATPGIYEGENADREVEQIIRPTGILDPIVEVVPTKNQIDDMIERVRSTVRKKQRVLITTLTKKFSEKLTDYLLEYNLKVNYLHSEIETIKRSAILRSLRAGEFDVLIGINLLREGLDLPEVSLVLILDADKEGYLRSKTSLIQTIGRAARHIEGRAVLYADRITYSMQQAIDITERRRKIQNDYNDKHGIVPKSISKGISSLIVPVTNGQVKVAEEPAAYRTKEISTKDMLKVIKNLERSMKDLAKRWEFEQAAQLRDKIRELRADLATRPI